MPNTATFATTVDWTVSMSSPEVVAARSAAAKAGLPAPVPEGAIVAEASHGKIVYRFIRDIRRCYNQGDAAKEAHGYAKHEMMSIAPWGLGSDFDDVSISVSKVS